MSTSVLRTRRRYVVCYGLNRADVLQRHLLRHYSRNARNFVLPPPSLLHSYPLHTVAFQLSPVEFVPAGGLLSQLEEQHLPIVVIS